jgi:hypothetical protein
VAAAVDPTPTARVAFAVFLADWESPEAAIEQHLVALDEACRAADPTGRAICCHNLSILYRMVGQPVVAHQFEQRALAAELDRTQREAGTLSPGIRRIVAHGLSERGETESARQLLRGAAGRTDEDHAQWCGDVAVRSAREGDLSEAIRLCLTGAQTYRQSGNLRGLAHTLVNLGHLLYADQRFREAAQVFRRAGPLWRRLGCRAQGRAAEAFASESRRLAAYQTSGPDRN